VLAVLAADPAEGLSRAVIASATQAATSTASAVIQSAGRRKGRGMADSVQSVLNVLHHHRDAERSPTLSG
jgi:hypothetical protein